MRTCYMLIGPPCSGKSTALNNIHIHSPVASSDSFFEHLAKQSNIDYGEAFKRYTKIAFKMFDLFVDELIQRGTTFVWDQTNTNRKSRRSKIERLKKADYEVIGIVFNEELNVLLERNEKRYKETGKFIPEHIIKNMYSSFEYPTEDEGFTEIIERN